MTPKLALSAEHLRGKSPQGCVLPESVNLDEPLSQDDFLLSFAMCKWLFKESKCAAKL